MIDELADLVLGARCPGCGAPGLGVCDCCRAVLAPGCWPVADAPATGGLTVFSSGDYDGPLRELLNAHKDRGALTLAGLLGARLVPGIVELQERCPAGVVSVLVPVPSSASAVRQRGYDHCLALARSAARRMPRDGGRTVARRVLRRRTAVLDQAGLSREQRRRNQSRSMVARPPHPGEAALLVDDICTTGASLAEAARALRVAGWPVLGAVVVAHPERHR